MRTKFRKIKGSIYIRSGEGNNWLIKVQSDDGGKVNLISGSIHCHQTSVQFWEQEHKISVLDVGTILLSLFECDKDNTSSLYQTNTSKQTKKGIYCNRLEINSLASGVALIRQLIKVNIKSSNATLSQEATELLAELDQRLHQKNSDFSITQQELDILAKIYEATR